MRDGSLSTDAVLRPGDEQQCPRCRDWHRLEARNGEGTDYATRMLYVTCGGALYFAGTIGGVSRTSVRVVAG